MEGKSLETAGPKNGAVQYREICVPGIAQFLFAVSRQKEALAGIAEPL
jgi:hypothetical protein